MLTRMELAGTVKADKDLASMSDSEVTATLRALLNTWGEWDPRSERDGISMFRWYEMVCIEADARRLPTTLNEME